MKEVEACAKQSVPFMPLQKRDLNALNNVRHHKIAKLRADLHKINIKQLDSSSAAEKTQARPKTDAGAVSRMRGVDLQKIQAHLSATKHKNRVEADPFGKQSEINRMMRATLFNWLLEVSTKFQLNNRTMFLCAQIFDRFLLHCDVQKKNLQLLGITCLHVASKFEDVHPPRLRDLCFLCNDIYKPADILLLEESILAALDFNLVFVSALDVVELNMAMRDVLDARSNELIMFVLHSYLIQGTISMVDSFKLASYTCTLVQGRCSAEPDCQFGELSCAESGKLELCLKQMLGTIKKYRLTALEKGVNLLPRDFFIDSAK